MKASTSLLLMAMSCAGLLACSSEEEAPQASECDLPSLCKGQRNLGPAEKVIGILADGRGVLVGTQAGLELLSTDGSREVIQEGSWGELRIEGERILGLQIEGDELFLWEHPSQEVHELPGEAIIATGSYPFEVCGPYVWYLTRSHELRNCGEVRLTHLPTSTGRVIGEACDEEGRGAEGFARFSPSCDFLSFSGIEEFKRIELPSHAEDTVPVGSWWRRFSASGERVIFRLDWGKGDPPSLFTAAAPDWSIGEVEGGSYLASLSPTGRWITLHPHAQTFRLIDMDRGVAYEDPNGRERETEPIFSHGEELIAYQRKLPGEGLELALLEASSAEVRRVSPMNSKVGLPVYARGQTWEVSKPRFSRGDRFLVWEDVDGEVKTVSSFSIEDGLVQTFYRGSVFSTVEMSADGERVVTHDMGKDGCLHYADVLHAKMRGCIAKAWTSAPVLDDSALAYLNWEGDVIWLPLPERD